MNQEETSLFHVSDFKDELVSSTLNEVYEALQERGYQPENQIIGYLISGDPGYISSHKNARAKMTALDRSDIIATLLRGYLNHK